MERGELGGSIKPVLKALEQFLKGESITERDRKCCPHVSEGPVTLLEGLERVMRGWVNPETRGEVKGGRGKSIGGWLKSRIINGKEHHFRSPGGLCPLKKVTVDMGLKGSKESSRENTSTGRNLGGPLDLNSGEVGKVTLLFLP